MFLWWQDPYTLMTVGMAPLTVALMLRLFVVKRGKGGRWGWASWMLAILWLLAAGPWLFLTVHSASAAGVTENSPAPVLTLSLANGDGLSLDTLKGKVVLLDFWASWCAPCRASEPALNDLAKRYAGRLEVVRISGDQDAEQWRVFLRGHPSYGFEAIDTEGRGTAAFHVSGLPTFLLIDRSGKVHWRQTSWTPFSYLILRHHIAGLLR